MEFDVALLAALFGGLLSFLMRFPFFANWYEQLTDAVKQYVMIAGNFLITAAVVALACTGNLQFVGIAGTCEAGWILNAAFVFFSAIVGNQSTYSMTKYIGRKPAG